MGSNSSLLDLLDMLKDMRAEGNPQTFGEWLESQSEEELSQLVAQKPLTYVPVYLFNKIWVK